MKKSRYLSIFIFIEIISIVLSIYSAKSGHGSYFWAKLFFPFTMISTYFLFEITLPFIIIALVQFPIYGIVLDITSNKKRRFLFASVSILVIHTVLFIYCLFVPSQSF